MTRLFVFYTARSIWTFLGASHDEAFLAFNAEFGPDESILKLEIIRCA